MNWGMELQDISISDYKERLKKQNLLAGRRVLKDQIEERFEEFGKQGLNNLAELSAVLGDSQRLDELAAQTNLTADYLLILKRELSSVIPKPVLIADFPYVLPDAFKILGECCIQTSKDFLKLLNGEGNVKEVCAKTGLAEDSAVELGSLCDLVRISGVGPVFARLLFEAGYRSVREIAAASAESILNKTAEINEMKRYTRVILEEREIQLCIDFAKLISKDRV